MDYTCECGCGQIPVRLGARYMVGHANKHKSISPDLREKQRKFMLDNNPNKKQPNVFELAKRARDNWVNNKAAELIKNEGMDPYEALRKAINLYKICTPHKEKTS